MPDNKARKRIRAYLDKERTHYEELRQKLEDPKRLLAFLSELYAYLEPILKIDANSEPHSAMFAIGQVKGGIEDVYREIAFYNDYRSKRTQLAQLVDEDGVPDQEQSANLDGSVEMAVT